MRPGPGAGRGAGGLAPLLLALFLPSGMECSEPSPAAGRLQLGRTDATFQMPEMLNERTPFRHPREAWKRGEGGTVKLRIHVAADGSVDAVRLAESSGVPALDSAALEQAWSLRYRPARQGERPVPVWGTLPVRYPTPDPTPASSGGRR